MSPGFGESGPSEPVPGEVVPRVWYAKAVRRIAKLETRLGQLAPDDELLHPARRWGSKTNTRWRRSDEGPPAE